MEYNAHLLSLSTEAEQQHAIISQWESQNNKLYKNSRNTAVRWQDRRPNTDPDLDADRGLIISLPITQPFATTHEVIGHNLMHKHDYNTKSHHMTQSKYPETHFNLPFIYFV
jgi:hypothetical protein